MRRERKHERKSSLIQSSPKKTRTVKETSSRTVNKPKKQKNKGKFLKNFLYVAFVCLFICMIIGLGIGVGMYAAVSQEINDMNVQDLNVANSSIVYYNDKDGNSCEAAILTGQGNSIWVESDEIAPIMKTAMVSIEDERFYEHSGVDIKRTTGAIFGYIKEKIGFGIASYGGSTITQQVVKNITKDSERTATRKVKEMMRAVAIEKELSKDEILSVYLNVIYLANGCNGVEAASNLYFNKDAKDLNLQEASLIAGITQRPSYFDPFKNPENAKKKRNTVLDKMYELGKISKEECEETKALDLGLSKKHKQQNSKIYSYFVDAVISDVVRDLQKEKGYSKEFAETLVQSGGLKIYTTMDYDIQSAIEEVFENNSNFPSAAKNAQAAMVIVDQKTGEVKAMVGGKGEKKESRGLNRATQALRQPGSSIKPLSVYSPAVEEGKILESDTIVDEKIKIKEWEPKNSYDGYKGTMTIKKAVELSANIPAVKILQDIGVDTGYKYVTEKYHLSTIQTADKDLSPMALGGLTKGATVIDMAGAYSVFANGGEYNTPHTYTKVLDSANRVLLEIETKPERVISSATAFIISDMLRGVVIGSSGTGKLANLSNMTVYGKTGTTNSDYDKWFVGYTGYYTGAVWFGFDTPSSIKKAGVYNNISAKLWKQVMEKIHKDLEDKELEKPEEVVEAFVCTKSGKLAGKYCNDEKMYFKNGTEPTDYCSGKHSKYSSSKKTTTNNTVKKEETENSEKKETESSNNESSATENKKTQSSTNSESTENNSGAITLD